MFFTCGHAAGLPPGMIEGPKRAPSSPPDTPVPTKRMPFSARSLVRRFEFCEERIAAIDDDVALFEVRHDLVDCLVDDVAGFDHDHDATRSLELRAELCNGVCAFNGGPFCLVGKKLVDLGGRPVEDRDLESVVGHVEHEVLAHNGEANQSNIASSFWHSFVRSENFIVSQQTDIVLRALAMCDRRLAIYR